MKGLAKLIGGGVGFIEVETPKILTPYNAILKPIAVTPCSSDVHAAFEVENNKAEDWILGHECVAEVVETGELVKDFKPGDIVAVPSVTPDWRAYGSQEGNLTHAKGPFSAFILSGTDHGVFAEYFRVPDADTDLCHIPEGVTIDQALMCVDVVTTGFTGVESADIQYGDTVCVIGIGPIGLMAVAGARLKGAGRIIAVGTRTNCVQLAKEFGATDIISYKNGDIVEQIYSLTGGKGVDVAIVAGGNNKTFEQAILMTRYNGRISNINYYVSTEPLQIPMLSWGKGMSGKTITGELCKGGRARVDRLMQLVKYGRIAPEKLITRRYEGFGEMETALYAMRDKEDDLVKAAVYLR